MRLPSYQKNPAFLCLLLGISGCAGTASTQAPVQSAHPEAQSAHPAKLHWIHDDLPAALQDARAHQRPLLIDFWADWCHTCINMKHTVLAEPSLAKMGPAFTWVALDTENPVNKAALERYPPLSWPTFFVIDPQSELAMARFSGGASLAQFEGFLQQSLKDAATLRDAKDKQGPAWLLVQGHQAMKAKDFQGARTAYRKALELAPTDWPRRVDTQVLVLRSYAEQPEQAAACVDFVRASYPEQDERPTSAEFFYFAHKCLSQSPDDAGRQGLLQKILDRMELILTQKGSKMSVDDQSTLLAEMRRYAESLGLNQRARGYALVQRELLDQAANSAQTPYEASMYNWPREEVYVYLGEGEKLLPALQASEQALPQNYDPPYRIAWLHHALGNKALAKAAAERSLALVQGPRRLRVLDLLDKIAQLDPAPEPSSVKKRDAESALSNE